MNSLELTLLYLLAAVLGVVACRSLKLPPMLGYLAVGVVIGPNALSLAQNTTGIQHLAEFGVVFLMFVIGLEFNLQKLRAMRKHVFGLGLMQVVLTIAVVTIGSAFLAAMAPTWWLLDWKTSLALSGAMAMSSTAIVIKLMADRLELETEHGKRVVGVLLFQDLAVVPLLVLIPALGAPPQELAWELGKAGVKAALLIALLLTGGQRIMRWWLTLVARRKSEELFVLNLLLVTLGLAWLTELAGLSLALGAFIAGMLISETEYKHQVETDIRPFHDVLLGLFFITIGMMLDWRLVLERWPLVLLLVTLPVLFKLGLITAIARLTGASTGLAKGLTAELGDVPIEFGDLLGMNPGAEDAPVVKLLQTVFEEAMRLRASDIHFEPQEKALRIRFRIDGVLHIQTEADAKISSAVALRLKLMSGLDISEKRLPQDGRFNIKVRANPVDVRISTLPTQFGESVVMRLLNQNTGLLELDRIGMPERVLERFRHALKRPSGMVLVTGPTGSGKTTTLYAALNELNSPEKKVITVEDPVEYRLSGLNQVQVHEKIDLSFSRVLRTVLRQDPDIVLIGEMRDQETAEIGMRAAMTGHLVLSTLHTNDAVSTPIRLLDMGVPRYMVALSVHMVVAQRLVRVICGNCRETYTLTPSEHEWLRYELGDQVDSHAFHHGRGCTHCANTGYQGRTGVYEFLEMSDRVVEAINHEDPGEFMRVARQQMAGETLRRDAVRLVLAGQTTVAEAMRISNQFEE